MSQDALLELRNLRVAFDTDEGVAHPVDGVELRLAHGQTLGMVGESGCGKSVTALSILRLLPTPPAHIDDGEILFRGRNLLALSEDELRRVRGKEIGMVFQEPMTSLNPVFTCGEQIAEVLRLHDGLNRSAARDRAIELLELVRIPDGARRAREYPHQLSGGMRQRVMIAMAIACRPALLIADEPTTALDVTIQSQILRELDELQEDLSMSILHITHDLAVIAESAHQVVVMYAGRVVESAPAEPIFSAPAHPYTLGLLACRPELGGGRPYLPSIPGRVPEPWALPKGCRFQDRCPFAVERCSHEDPSLESIAPQHEVACWEWRRVQEQGRWPDVGA